MRKADRHQVIKKIIQTKEINTQEELLNELKNQGIEATQATISRDIRELKIVKKADLAGQVRFELFENFLKEDENTDHQELLALIKDSVTKIDTAQFLTVVHTLANNAQILSAALDEYPMKEKIATLAGFDTVVIISRTIEDAHLMSQFIESHMEN